MMNKLNLSGVSVSVLVRMVITVLVAINLILGYLGKHIIPVNEGDITMLVNAGIVILSAVVWFWGWWKNNSFTANAQAADIFLEKLNANKNEQMQLPVD